MLNKKQILANKISLSSNKDLDRKLKEISLEGKNKAKEIIKIAEDLGGEFRSPSYQSKLAKSYLEGFYSLIDKRRI